MKTLKSICLLLCMLFVTPAMARAEEAPPAEQWTLAVTALADREQISLAHANAALIAWLNPPRYVHARSDVDRWFDVAMAAGWPQDLWRWQSCVINRESGGQAGVRSRTSDYGLMQINRVNLGFLRSRGIAWQMTDLFDPYTNLVAAKALFDLNGKRPWTAQRKRC